MTLSLHDVCFRIGDKQIVEDVSLDIVGASVTALIGPNGAGKSTVLRLAAGEIEPSRGIIALAGRNLNRWSKLSLARTRSVLPQRSQLEFAFTAMQVVMLGRFPHGLSEREDRRICLEALEAVGMQKMAHRVYTSLSGGERQRVHLARVIAQSKSNESQLILLDEPTAALDLPYQHAVLQRARLFAEVGLAVLVVLHDLNLASQYADNVVVMNRGRVVARGDARDILQPATLEPVFGVNFEIERRNNDQPTRLWAHPHDTLTKGDSEHETSN